MFETTLLDSSAGQSPVPTGRHRMIAMLAGTTVFVAAWKSLPLVFFSLNLKGVLVGSLALGTGVAVQILMVCYAASAARRLGLSRVGWLAAVLLASGVGFMAFLIRAARRTGDWRSAAMPIATTLEVAVLGVLLLIPLIRTQALDLRNLPDQIAPLPPPPPAVRIIAVVHERPTTPLPSLVRNGRVIAPDRIPDEVFRIVDEPAPQLDTGVIGGDPTGAGVQGSVLLDLLQNASRNSPPPTLREHAAKPVERIVKGGDVQAAKLIFAPTPEYPAIAKIAHVQGTVRMEAIISGDGSIQSLRVLGGNPLLVPAARDTVVRWRYQPTLLNGEPVEVQTEIVVNFILGN